MLPGAIKLPSHFTRCRLGNTLGVVAETTAGQSSSDSFRSLRLPRLVLLRLASEGRTAGGFLVRLGMVRLGRLGDRSDDRELVKVG